MQGKSQIELYEDFVTWVNKELEKKKSDVNRRMFSVALWCFILPATLSLLALILIKTGILGHGFRGMIDWILLVFPVGYAFYFLGSEVLKELPWVKKQSLPHSLKVSLESTRSRGEVANRLQKEISADSKDWKFIYSNFETDLKRLHYRNRYITALAGAVFFLILEGVDAIDEKFIIPESPNSQMFFILLEYGFSQISKYVALGFVLVLMYLTGSQQTHRLGHYLESLKLLITKD